MRTQWDWGWRGVTPRWGSGAESQRVRLGTELRDQVPSLLLGSSPTLPCSPQGFAEPGDNG